MVPSRMKLPKLRVDHVAVDAHDPEPGGDGDRLVRHHPDPAGIVGHLHREGHRRVDRAVARVLQRTRDAVGGLVDDLAAAVELLVGHAARRSTGRCRGSSSRPGRCSSSFQATRRRRAPPRRPARGRRRWRMRRRRPRLPGRPGAASRRRSRRVVPTYAPSSFGRSDGPPGVARSCGVEVMPS